VRGLGTADEYVFHTDMTSILAPWTTARAKKEAAKRASQRVEAEGGLPKEDMAWHKGMNMPSKAEPGLRPGQRYILKDFSGLLRPGEMMLVLGRPGSGCSTFLKTLSGLTGAYAGVEGEVKYGTLLSGSRDFKPYRSLVCYNSEEDDHDPNLTVGRTMDFATRNELVSKSARPVEAQALSDDEFRIETKNRLLDTFAIGHTHDTKVGNQYVRGVSGTFVMPKQRWDADNRR
jgi:ABC-type multidrug transport system ATPase subunit